MEMIRKEYTVPSKCGVADIYARCWMPADGVKAIFQISHGMAEHGERYENFASYLCDKGFAVVVEDHMGHGKSINTDDDLGYFGEENGWAALVEDERAVTELVKADFPDAPVIFFGHSMGSFVAREYILRYGRDERIKGAIFCGTSGKNPAAAVAIHLADAIAKVKGGRHRSEFINKMAFGPYNMKTEKRTAFDWLSSDNGQIDKYVADKYCGFVFTAAGYKDLFTILTKISGKDWYTKLPELPILLPAGDMDPVGNYGKGVKQVYNDLIQAGHKDVTLKIYPGMRHEVLNEVENKKVYEDIAAWALSKIR